MKSAKIAILVAAAIPIAAVLAILCDGFIWGQKRWIFETPGMAIAMRIVPAANRDQYILGTTIGVDSVLWFGLLCGGFAAVRAFRRKGR